MEIDKLMSIVEGLLFVSGDPVNIGDLSRTLEISEDELLYCVRKLQEDYSSPARGIMVSQVGKCVRLTTKPDIFPYVEKMFKPKVNSQLSRAALETLAIILFKQPVTKTEIEAIRGVNVEKALSSLQEKNLVHEIGRLDAPGRPILYGATDYCMEYFGISTLEDIQK
ncbi:MAG: segregation and condensation protein [Thermoanaerobacteraceae bacterium]|jgi:segregation and condensation protein B|nr:segregation and condensation protein [Thermoanaerobacteraceae bacterium]MDN5311420.1 segregation and condensation protein [Thermoanaerobacteraceae bacterium]RKL64185.1 SMC-Scp complex subunit ScpB [Thermoanaerobacteraceae bacterium SP2]